MRLTLVFLVEWVRVSMKFLSSIFSLAFSSIYLFPRVLIIFFDPVDIGNSLFLIEIVK